MSEEDKPREQLDSVWGEVARMEAEIQDPEEVETSVYNINDFEGLKEQMEKAKARRARAGKRPPAAPAMPERAKGAPPVLHEADDEDEDETSVFDSGRIQEAAKRLRAGGGPRGAAKPAPSATDDVDQLAQTRVATADETETQPPEGVDQLAQTRVATADESETQPPEGVDQLAQTRVASADEPETQPVEEEPEVATVIFDRTSVTGDESVGDEASVEPDATSRQSGPGAPPSGQGLAARPSGPGARPSGQGLASRPSSSGELGAPVEGGGAPAASPTDESSIESPAAARRRRPSVITFLALVVIGFLIGYVVIMLSK
jgi:hypothetical protein